MTADQARAAFARARVARLATVSADGSPHLVPICFALDGERLWSAVDHKPKRGVRLARLRNIEVQPRVTVLADRYEDGDWSALWWARADGRARVVGLRDAEHERAVELLGARYAQYREQPPTDEVIAIDVERWSGWGTAPRADDSLFAPAISHLDLVVSSLEHSLRFYRGLLEPLGWSRLSEIVGERGERVLYLGIPGRTGSLGLRERQSGSGAHDRYALGVHHVCFDVASRAVVDERWEWLRTSGAQIESDPREYHYTPGYYAVFLYDPDGIKLELVHRPPGA